MTQHTQTPTAPKTRLRPDQRRAIAAACIGNFLEWYEFVLYGYFAGVFAILFFPQADPAVALMTTFLVFGISFIIRPLGGLFFGYIGDKLGRKAALSAIILLISLATAVMGLVPPYASIGVLAPILIFLMRLLQGLSAGGEWMGAVTYIIETSPVHKRAWYGSFQTVTITGGMFVAALASLIVTTSMTTESMHAWGWRVPFIVALPLGLIGLWMRLRLADPKEFTEARQEQADSDAGPKSPILQVFKTNWRSILLITGLVASPTMCTYVLLVWGPTFFGANLGFTDNEARNLGLISMLVLMTLVLIFAKSCDRFGRKPFIIWGAIIVVVGTPVGFLLLHTEQFALALVGIALILIGDAMMLAAQPALFAELFPTSQRYSGLAVGYNLGVVLFGGLGPLIAQALVTATGSTWSPGWYLIGGGIVSFIAALFTPETRGAKLRTGAVSVVTP